MTRQPTATDLAYLRDRGAVDTAHARRVFDRIHEGTAVNLGPGVLDRVITDTAPPAGDLDAATGPRIADGDVDARKRTTTQLRGYPLPPWAREGRYPDGRELLEWLDGKVTIRQAAAYLDDLLARYSAAQMAASTCDVEDHVGVLSRSDAELRVAVGHETDARANGCDEKCDPGDSAHGHHLGLDVLRITLAFDGNVDLDGEARDRVLEAAGVGAYQAYERERVAAAVVDYKAGQRQTSAPAASITP